MQLIHWFHFIFIFIVLIIVVSHDAGNSISDVLYVHVQLGLESLRTL